MAEVLPDEPRTRGGFTRLLGSDSAGRSALTALIAGIAGTGAFVASLVVDWLHVTMGRSDAFGIEEREAFRIGLDAASFAVAYMLGGLGLIALVGMVVGRPDLARRLRMGAAALGVGVVGVLLAITEQMRNILTQIYGFRLNFAGSVPPDLQQAIDNTTYAPLLGQFLAFGAVVALVAAVWLAAGPVRGEPAAGLSAASGYVTVSSAAGAEPLVLTAPGSPVPPSDTAATAATKPAAAPVGPLGPPGLPADRSSTAAAWPPARVGYVDGLSVTSSDTIDPGTQTDILRS